MTKFNLLIFSVFFLFISCRKKSDSPLWNVDALAPLVQTSLTLDNIIKDTSSAITKNPDKSMSVVVRENVASVTADSLVTLKVNPYTKKVKLSTLVLNQQTVTRQITLGELTRALIATEEPTNVFIGNLIRSNQGNNIFMFPAITNLNSPGLPLDIKQFFDDATFLDGDMEISIVNNLPVDITNLHFDVRNQSNGFLITDNTFTGIAKNGGTAMQTVDLSGKTVEGNLYLNLLDLDLGSGSNIVVDTNKAITLDITIKNVSLSAATAIFPEQNIIDNTEKILLQGLGEIELYEAWIQSGNVKAIINSTLKSQFDVTYYIPSASKNSVPFEISRTIAGSTNGDAVVEEINENFADYKMNLRGVNNDTVNTIVNRLVGKLPYTGQKVRITLQDSVDVVVTMENPIPSYVKGYLGRDTAQIGPNSISLGLFSKIESGVLNFENTNINMIVENGLGITGAIKINSVSAKNNKTGAMVTMTGPNINNTINIQKAVDAQPIVPIVSTIDLSTGSNATSLLNILPDQFFYDVQVISNPGGNDMTYNDFAYASAGLNAYLDIEMPLSFLASNLTLSDTIDFSTAGVKKKNINNGTFSIHADNGFPLDASLKMYFLDQNNAVIDSLYSPASILAAPVDANNRVSEKRKSFVDYEVDASKMANIYNASKVIFKVRFSTEPVSTFLKIYSDYSIDFKLIGDVNYSVR